LALTHAPLTKAHEITSFKTAVQGNSSFFFLPAKCPGAGHGSVCLEGFYCFIRETQFVNLQVCRGNIR